MGSRQIKMIEIIIITNLPNDFSGTSEAKDVWNEVKNYSHELHENRLKWISENEF